MTTPRRLRATVPRGCHGDTRVRATSLDLGGIRRRQLGRSRPDREVVRSRPDWGRSSAPERHVHRRAEAGGGDAAVGRGTSPGWRRAWRGSGAADWRRPERCSSRSMLTCHRSSSGVPGTASGRAPGCGSRFHSCSIAGATAPPAAAAAHAADGRREHPDVALGDADRRQQPARRRPRVRRRRVDRPLLLAQRLQRAGRRAVQRWSAAATTSNRYRSSGSLTTPGAAGPASAGPTATSARRSTSRALHLVGRRRCRGSPRRWPPGGRTPAAAPARRRRRRRRRRRPAAGRAPRWRRARPARSPRPGRPSARPDRRPAVPAGRERQRRCRPAPPADPRGAGARRRAPATPPAR